MAVTGSREGRPRSYGFAPVDGFANPDAAHLVAALDELHERLFDLIGDLPPRALEFVPEGGTNSISMLALHMAHAEASWIAAATETEVPEEIGRELKAGAQDETGELRASSPTGVAADLVETAMRVREEFTKRQLAPLGNIDSEVASGDRILTVRGVLMNQLWHWTYHTGQVGLLRRLAGMRYAWRYDRRIAAGP